MVDIANRLNPEDILALAASTNAAIDAQRFAQLKRWQALGNYGNAIWGQFQDTRPLQVSVDLTKLYSKTSGTQCSCYNSKPCEHALALLLLWTQNHKAFVESQLPSFVQAISTSGYALYHSEALTLDAVRNGLHELELWLTNLIRYGLAQPHVRENGFWNEISDRMSAVWLPELSFWLRDIARIAVRSTVWIEPLLAELGRMMLLIRSFERFEQLSADIQADLREAVGWRLTQNETLPDQAVRDHWLVIGERQRILRDQALEQLTWLYGTQSRQLALLHTSGGEFTQTTPFPVGRVINAELVYLPSRSPLRAILSGSDETPHLNNLRGWNIEDAIKGFGEAIAKNPWVRHYPLLLDDVYVARFDKGWTLRHANGAFLPIASHFQHKWIMHSVSGGYPIQVAGTWNGSTFFPLSIIHHDRVVNLNRAAANKPKHRKLAVP